ncbi:MAG: hypothetical protein HKN68_07700 [Saprospiraceae bacterium]|nr:hypothetical protein [Saprospiraceae bacterium]
MKLLLTLSFIVSSLCLTANDGVQSVQANMIIQDGSIAIIEEISYELSNDPDSLIVKILPFEGSELFIDSILMNDAPQSYEILTMKPIIIIKLSSVKNGMEKLIFHYRIAFNEASFFIPLFFSDLTATKSQSDFFNLKMNWSKDEDYNIHFPKVPMEVKENANQKFTTLEMPAAPSLVRMQRVEGHSSLSFNQVVDLGVGAVFLLIGLLLWMNRKKLAYG